MGPSLHGRGGQHGIQGGLGSAPQYVCYMHVKNISQPVSQQDVFALLVPSCWQVWNRLLSSCNKDSQKVVPTSLIQIVDKLMTTSLNSNSVVTNITDCWKQPVASLLSCTR